MLSKQLNRSSLILAIIIILLCLSCLAGATYALFTNDPHDGTIGVVSTAGKIKVDVVDPDTQESLLDDVLTFYIEGGDEDGDGDGEIWFEPGMLIRTTGFKVKNIGTISINFRISVSKDSKIDANEFNRAFELWISTDPDSIDEAKPIQLFEDDLAPEALSENTYYLFIKMKETAGNEFQEKEYRGIGVTVYAIQGNKELEE